MIYSERLRVFLHALDGPDEAGIAAQEGPVQPDPAGTGVCAQPEHAAGIPGARPEGRTDGIPVPDRVRFAAFRREEEQAGIPIIRREMESFLQVLLELKQPGRILEIGAAEGFSSLWMASCTPQETVLTTIEQDPERIGRAREHFAMFPAGERISLLEGDAQQILPALDGGSFDFVFMDAAKAQYIHFLPDVLRVMKKGGILVSDNVLQDGVILEPGAAVERRDRTIHRRMREYLKVLKQTYGLLTTVVPIGDGAAVTVKRKEICIDRDRLLNC
jgi:predicted O-methyltransferase YrrM